MHINMIIGFFVFKWFSCNNLIFMFMSLISFCRCFFVLSSLYFEHHKYFKSTIIIAYRHKQSNKSQKSESVWNWLKYFYFHFVISPGLFNDFEVITTKDMIHVCAFYLCLRVYKRTKVIIKKFNCIFCSTLNDRRHFFSFSLFLFKQAVVYGLHCQKKKQNFCYSNEKVT